MLSLPRLNVLLICCVLCLLSSTTLTAKQGDSVTVPPVIQIPQTFPPQTTVPTYPQVPQGQIIEGPIVPGPIYDGQGRIIRNGSGVVPRQIIGQPVPGTIIPPTTPTEPVRPRVPRTPKPVNQEDEELRTTLLQATASIVNLKAQNEELRGRIETVAKERDIAMADLVELKKMPAVENNDQAIQQLEGQVLQLTTQIRTLNAESDQLRVTNGGLSEENAQLKEQIGSINMTDNQLVEVRAALNSRTSELQELAGQLEVKTGQLEIKAGELEVKTGEVADLNSQLNLAQKKTLDLTAEVERLSGMQLTAESRYEELNDKIALLSTERTDLLGQISAFKSNLVEIAPIAPIEPTLVEPTLVEPAPVETLPVETLQVETNVGVTDVAPPMEPVTITDPAQTATIEKLTNQNRLLLRAKSSARERNALLESKLAKLESHNDSLWAANAELESSRGEIASQLETSSSNANALTLPAISETPDGESGMYSINYWILPFILTGLAIAFYVVLREEFLKRPAAQTNDN